MHNDQWQWLSYSRLRVALSLVLMIAIFWSCDNESDNGAPKGEATIAITGEFNDSLTFTPTFQRLPDSSGVIPGPDSFKTNVQIKGGKASPDSFRMELYIMDEQAKIQERAYLVKRLTLENEPTRAAALVVQTADKSLYQTQLSKSGKGTVVVNRIANKEIEGEIKGVQLSTGSKTITLNGTFKAGSP